MKQSSSNMLLSEIERDYSLWAAAG